MEKFTKEEKELLEKNPNIQAVLSNQVLYTKDFKEKAVKEYENGKTANQIFQEAGINTHLVLMPYGEDMNNTKSYSSNRNIFIPENILNELALLKNNSKENLIFNFSFTISTL